MPDEKQTKTRRATTDLEAGTVTVYGPPGDDGKPVVFKVISLGDPSTWNDKTRNMAAWYGAAYIAQNSYNRHDNPTPEQVVETVEKTLAALADGTWTPGRTFGFGEQPDIVHALAEYYKVPLHVMAEDIENRIVRGEDGEPVKDAKNRNKRVFTKAVLEHLAQEPAIRPIMARLAKERADRLAKEAREAGRNHAAPTGALDLFAGRFEGEREASDAAEQSAAA